MLGFCDLFFFFAVGVLRRRLEATVCQHKRKKKYFGIKEYGDILLIMFAKYSF